MPRVVGCDPGTSSLDMLFLNNGVVAGEVSVPAGDDGRKVPEALTAWAPIDLVAGPSGYGLPLVRGEDVTPQTLDLMTLVRPDDRNHGGGVRGLKGHIRTILASGVPVVFLPGGIHLPTIPAHRKLNAMDMGTPDKLCVVALALRQHASRTGRPLAESTFGVLEVGTAFSAILVVSNGRLVDAAAGTRGPIGLRSAGAWDAETAYALSPLSKTDLFRGGLDHLGPAGPDAFRESLHKHLAALRAITPFDTVYLSGKGLERADVDRLVREAAADLVSVLPLPGLPGATVKHAAQGAALLADGLAGGNQSDLVRSLELARASGTIGDALRIRPGGPPRWMLGSI